MLLLTSATVRCRFSCTLARFGIRSRQQTAALMVLTLLAASAPCRAKPSVTVTGQMAGPTPFISLVSLSMDHPAWLDYVTFTVVPKPGSVTRPISARYSAAYLRRRGYIDERAGVITVPVFGLYAGYANAVRLTASMVSGASEKNKLTITTAGYHGDNHKHPTVVQARTADTSLSYDYILVKSSLNQNSPIIIDTDGEIRWAGTTGIDFTQAPTLSGIFYGNGIYVATGTTLLRIELDGAVDVLADYADQGVYDFHHNIDVGRDGLILDADTYEWTECINMEVDPATGAVLHTWNYAEIISDAMKAGGDDPTQFVKPASNDWFHNNATAYRPSDDSLIVSSRENFVMAVDYDTHALKWILGDPGKYWHQFPSLASYALQLAPHTQPPIGQHAVSFVRDRLLLFDNGYASISQPVAGKNRTHSVARKYVIDATARTATETWRYANDKTTYSPICSSIYEDQPHNFLLDYATGGPFEFTELVGLSAAQTRVFAYRYPAPKTCNEGWNSEPVHLENMVFN